MSELNDFFEESEEDELINKLKSYDAAYYIEGNTPLLTDEEYDQFKEYVRTKYPNNLYFQEVGSIKCSGEKIKHEFVLGSLTKFKADNIDKWLSKYPQNEEVIITPKYDGLTNYCYLDDNELILSTTRGNGVEGQDITKKTYVFFPSHRNSGMLKVRGETLLPGNLFEKFGFANRRNSTSGIVGRDEFSNELKALDIVFYEIIDCDEEFQTEEDRLNHINKVFPNNRLFFEKVKIKEITTEFLRKTLEEFKQKLISYCDIDGLVLTINNSVRENEKYPKNKVAFKGSDESAIAEIDHIEWSVSRNGRLCPVVVFKNPIVLAGANIIKATAYNAGYVRDNNLIPGTKVEIVRSNLVIPKIIKVFH